MYVWSIYVSGDQRRQELQGRLTQMSREVLQAQQTLIAEKNARNKAALEEETLLATGRSRNGPARPSEILNGLKQQELEAVTLRVASDEKLQAARRRVTKQQQRAQENSQVFGEMLDRLQQELTTTRLNRKNTVKARKQSHLTKKLEEKSHHAVRKLRKTIELEERSK